MPDYKLSRYKLSCFPNEGPRIRQNHVQELQTRTPRQAAVLRLQDRQA
jgi:hypothetical protein